MNKQFIYNLFKQYKSHPTKKNRDLLTKELEPIVQNISKKFIHYGENPDDIVQIGLIGLLKAIEYYKQKSLKIDKIIPYIISMVIGEIKHYFRDNFHSIKIPRKYIDISYAMNGFIQEYYQKNKGKKPSVKEISRALHCSEELILETSEALQVGTLIGTQSQYAGNSSTGKKEFVTEKMYVKSFTDQLDTVLFIENIMQNLTYREQKILQMYFLKNVTQREIANRFRISQTQVFRILNHALKTCKQKITKAIHAEKN